MRVISGKYKGKRLFSPNNSNIRPTTDRIKETLFNILNSKNCVFNARVLDLFCGSGALGIEALSRGAISAIFIDSSRESFNLAKKNLAHIGAENAEIYNINFETALKKLVDKRFDLIFLDPPYDKGLELRAIQLIEKYDILDAQGVIVLEHSSKIDLQNLLKGYIIDVRKLGSTTISFLSKEEGK